MPYQNYRKNYKKNYGSLNKQKWAPYMKEIQPVTVPIPASGTNYAFATIVANSSETSTPTPTIIKVKHLKATFDTTAGTSVLTNGFVCFLYVPQGMTINAGTPILHPEWIMAWRGFELEYQSNSVLGKQVQLSSNMSRNLNSGDSVVLFWSIFNPSTVDANLLYHTRFSCVVRNN